MCCVINFIVKYYPSNFDTKLFFFGKKGRDGF